MLPFLLLAGGLAALAFMNKSSPAASVTPGRGPATADGADPLTIVREALASKDPNTMLAAAAKLKGMGLLDSAAQLEAAASRASSVVRTKTEEAVKEADAAIKGGVSENNPTTAAVTATKAADVVNKAAEAIADPSASAVKEVAKTALNLAQSAPASAAPQARAVLESTKQALATPDAASVATVARAATELAKASATPSTTAAATAATEAAKRLEASPTAETASKVAAVTSTAASTAIKAAQAPIAEPGRTTYIVQQGDSAWVIAQRITGNGARYPELIRANTAPVGSKTIIPIVKDGKRIGDNFTTLVKGEVLKLPASWVAAAPQATVKPPPASPAASPTPGWQDDLARMKTENANLYDPTMKVLGSKNPEALRKGADLVRAKYPNLAAYFIYLAAQASGTAPVMVSTPMTPATPPIAPPSTYVVKSGDSAWRIAQALVGTGTRWKELVAANPTKKKSPDGNFATLFAGEVLKVPESWSKVTPVTSGIWPRPARTLGGMGMYPIAA